VLGGRSLCASGAEYEILDDSGYVDLMVTLLKEFLDEHGGNARIYPFNRMAVIFLRPEEGRITCVYSMPQRGTSEIPIFLMDLAVSDGLMQIRNLLHQNSIQLYEIFRRTAAGSFRVLSYRGPDTAEMASRSRLAYDVFRCLDLFGSCRIRLTESDDFFHRYRRYDLGEGFYLEAYNSAAGRREHWLCRNRRKKKLLLFSSALDDLTLRHRIDEEGRLMIGQGLAAQLCELTDPQEYLLIDNDYRLAVRWLEEDETGTVS